MNEACGRHGCDRLDQKLRGLLGVCLRDLFRLFDEDAVPFKGGPRPVVGATT